MSHLEPSVKSRCYGQCNNMLLSSDHQMIFRRCISSEICVVIVPFVAFILMQQEG